MKKNKNFQSQNRKPAIYQKSFLIIAILLLSLPFYSCKQKMTKKAPRIPVENFFRNPEKASFQISPDGKFFSFTSPYKGRMNIFVQETSGKEAKQITSVTDRDISSYFWKNSNRILYLKDNGGDENFRLYGVNIDGSNPICLTNFDGVRTTIIDDLEDIDDEVIIGLNKRNNEVFDPYRLNIATGEMTMLVENPGNIQGWLADHDGKLRLAIAIDGTDQSILYRKTEKDSFQTVIKTNFKESVDPFFFTFDNKNVYASSNLGRDKQAIVVFNLETGKEVEKLYEDKDYDVSGLDYSVKRKKLTTISYVTWKRKLVYLDDLSGKLYGNLEKLLGDKYEISISSSNKAEDKFIIRTHSDRSLGAYYFYDFSTNKINKLHDISPWLDEDNLAEMKPIDYKSRDGLTIHGYLTLPVGAEAKNLPVVINPHGGPWARDVWGYDPEVQFLANRGYAVLQMNFRGSLGYGRKFWEISFKQWGKTMQNDITDGVNWLKEEKIADPKRIAIYGGSYGGYAVLAGLTFNPDVYCCGIDYVGVSNLFTLLKTIPPYWKPMLDMQYEMIGNPEKDKELYTEISPVFHVDKIKAPLFIAQGANDPRVNKNESDQMVEAMKKRGVEVEYMVKENEGHGFHNEENRFDFYRAMDKFLEKHMKDGAKH
jgi:dipeptidyl aminopeptidase/acylaminoacyl peptidase